MSVSGRCTAPNRRTTPAQRLAWRDSSASPRWWSIPPLRWVESPLTAPFRSRWPAPLASLSSTQSSRQMIPRARPARSRTPSESDVRRALSLSAPAFIALLLRHVRLSHRFLDFRQHRRTQEQLDQVRVELGALSLGDGASRLGEATCVTV